MSEQVIFGVPFDNYTPPSWDEWFIKIMYLVASKSKDSRTKIGAILVKDRRIISAGYNGLCMGVNDNVPERLIRPEKYKWYEHGERNTIYAAARYGISTVGSTMYTNGTPCTDCARGVIQAGITEVVVHGIYESICESPQKSGPIVHWIGHKEATTTMFNEAGVKLRIYESMVGVKAYHNGIEYSV
jgi:dCMP deaminase